jgi:hypothetical protein
MMGKLKKRKSSIGLRHEIPPYPISGQWIVVGLQEIGPLGLEFSFGTKGGTVIGEKQFHYLV